MHELLKGAELASKRYRRGGWFLIPVFAMGVATLIALICGTVRAAEIDAKSVASKLAGGKRILQQGKPDIAIHEYFDPVIRLYQEHYSKSGVAIYSAHSTVEAIMYAAIPGAAADKAEKNTAPAGRTEVIDGAWVDALELKGYALVELKREDEAIVVLTQATGLAPFYPIPWTELGYVYQTRKNWGAAMDAYKQAAGGAELVEDKEQDPKRPLYARALRGEGYVLTELGQLAEAEATYHECLQMNPDDGGARNELAYIAQLKQKSSAEPPAQPDPTSK